MLDNMPDDLFRHWHAYSRLKPFGHQDRILALIAARVINSTRGEGQEQVEIDDILPIARSPEEIMKREEAKVIEEMTKGSR
jgi:hypothetical protein